MALRTQRQILGVGNQREREIVCLAGCGPVLAGLRGCLPKCPRLVRGIDGSGRAGGPVPARDLTQPAALGPPGPSPVELAVQADRAGQAARNQDETWPLECGCIGQETTGAGGLAKALRTVPGVLDIAERGRYLGLVLFGALAVAAADCAGVLHLGGPERLSRLEMGQRLARTLGCAARIVPAGRNDGQPEPRPRDVSLDSSRWRRLFPGQPWPAHEEAVRDLLAR